MLGRTAHFPPDEAQLVALLQRPRCQLGGVPGTPSSRSNGSARVRLVCGRFLAYGAAGRIVGHPMFGLGLQKPPELPQRDAVVAPALPIPCSSRAALASTPARVGPVRTPDQDAKVEQKMELSKSVGGRHSFDSTPHVIGGQPLSEVFVAGECRPPLANRHRRVLGGPRRPPPAASTRSSPPGGGSARPGRRHSSAA